MFERGTLLISMLVCLGERGLHVW